MMMHNVPDTSGKQSVYECLQCGTIVTAESHPGPCEACGGSFQDRAMSLE